MAVPLRAKRTWTIVEDLRLGSGDEPNSFGSVGAVAVARNGNIFVVDRKPLQIKVFSPSGNFLRAVGRTGGGPGEYRDVSALMATPDGSVLAVAPQSSRVLIYSSEGLLVRDVTTTFQFYGGEWTGTIMRDGSLLDQIYLYPKVRQSITVEPPKALQRILPNGTRTDTLLYPGCQIRNPSKDAVVHISEENGKYRATRMPFEPMPQVAFANDGTAWCTPTDAYAVFHFRVGRPDTLHAIRLTVTAPAIPKADRDRMDQLIARADNRNNIIVPTVQPTIKAIRVDDVNRLWVRRTATPDSAPSFDLYDAQGKSLGVVQSTIRWDRIPLVVGNFAYGVVVGEDDVPFVVRARIRP